MESRESLLRDGVFDAPRRDSFIRDEFGASPQPVREAGSRRNHGPDEFFSESEWDEPRTGRFRIQRTEVVLAVAVIALIVGAVSVWTLVNGRNATAAQTAAAPVAPQEAPA